MTHIRRHGLQSLEGEILAFVGVAAGLRASLRLSTCCRSLRDALAAPVMDDQLFGRLYAALAGVENPSDAFLQPPPRHSFGPRCQQSDLIAPSSPPDGHDMYHTHHPNQRNQSANGSPPTRWSSRPLLPGNPGSPGLRKRPRSDPRGEQAVLKGRAAARSCDNVAAVASPMSGGCLPRPPPVRGMSVLGRTEQCNQRQPQDQRHQPSGTGRAGGGQRGAWRRRLKRDQATGKEPSDTFAFAGQQKGKQDVLMAVVPSTPPVIAVTCTTELSLFRLDGKRLSVVAVADTPPVRAADVDDDAFGEVETGAWGDTRRFSLRGRGFACDARSNDGNGTAAVASAVTGVAAAEGHQRDIRCLAASPSGEMVATGSLDCTIRVRSVPGGDWVRRLRGHNAGVRCLKFHRTNRLISADSLGMMAVWDVYPVSRRLQMVQGHLDSVQVLTWTGGGKRLASGALDGSVVLWSVSTEGVGDSASNTPLTPIVSYGGLCHPYRLVAVGRCLAFTSSTAPRATVMTSDQASLWTGPSDEAAKSSDGRVFQRHGDGGGGVFGGDGDADGLPPPVSKGAHISFLDVEPLTMIGGRSGRGRVSTGLARLQHLVPAPCLGAVMLSQTESWTEESGTDSADDFDHIEEGPDYLGGGRVTYKPPRLCRFVSAASATPFRSEAGLRRDRDGGGGGALEAGWVSVSRGQPDTATRHRHRGSSDLDKGHSGPDSSSAPSSSNNSNNVNISEDLDGGAFCTCATFVGRTLFLGYDTGEIWAYRAFDGHRLYRLSTCGSVAHLVEAEGSLFAYASSGVVSRWSWG